MEQNCGNSCFSSCSFTCSNRCTSACAGVCSGTEDDTIDNLKHLMNAALEFKGFKPHVGEYNAAIG